MPASSSIRNATVSDVPAMVALSSAKRSAYERVQPVFWRRSAGADGKQAPWFAHLVAKPGVIALVAGPAGITSPRSGPLDGFLIATETPVPPAYDPGGKAFTIDDFCVSAP